MPREKVKFAMRIRPETQELVRQWYEKNNSQLDGLRWQCVQEMKNGRFD